MKNLIKSYLIIFITLFLVIEAQAKESNKTINIALSSAPANLDPFFSTDGNSQNINRLTHLSLVDFSSKMTFMCRLCESYDEKILDGKHHIRFKLRKDKYFWDGTKVTAKDVEKSHLYFTGEEKIKSIFRFAFKKIKKVIVHDDYDVELIYDQFNLENLSNLTLLKILKISNAKIVGAGEYRYGKVSTLLVELLPAFSKGLPKLIFKVVKDETTLVLKLINDEIDLSLANISPRKINWLKARKNKSLSFWERPSSNFQYININHRREKLKDVRVREALSLLIPRREILKYKMKNMGVLATGMFSPAFADMYENSWVDEYNPTQAERILAKAGYRKNQKGFYAKMGEEFVLDWKVSNNKAALEMATTIKGYYEKAGIKVHLSTQEWGTFMRSFKGGNYDIVLGQWIGFTGPDMLRMVFHSDNFSPTGLNRGHFRNKDLDKLLDEATNTLDTEKRNELYKKVQRRANLEYAYINLWHPNIIWTGRSCLSHITLFPNGSYLPLLQVRKNCGENEK